MTQNPDSCFLENQYVFLTAVIVEGNKKGYIDDRDRLLILDYL